MIHRVQLSIVILICLYQPKLNAQINGSIESMEMGEAYLLNALTRDTLDAVNIVNHKFVFHVSGDLKLEDQALPGLIICLQHDRQQSSAAPVAIENAPVSITFKNEGYTKYSGTPNQQKYSDLIDTIRSYDKWLFDPNTGNMNDSIQRLIAIKFEEFYLNVRGTSFSLFTSMLILDFLDRQFINGSDLKKINGLCQAEMNLDSFDLLLCGAINETRLKWEGKEAIDFILLSSNSQLISLKDFIGKKIIILDFWASWCGPCIKEMPELKELYKSGAIEIIGISIDDHRDAWIKSLNRLHLPWINVLDDKDFVAKLYKVSTVPAKFVINKQGLIVAYNPEDLQSIIQRLN